jgi:hypothetical protein
MGEVLPSDVGLNMLLDGGGRFELMLNDIKAVVGDLAGYCQ